MEVVAMDVDLESHQPRGNHPLTLGWDDESEGCAWNWHIHCLVNISFSPWTIHLA
jgi:hypothetical protein